MTVGQEPTTRKRRRLHPSLPPPFASRPGVTETQEQARPAGRHPRQQASASVATVVRDVLEARSSPMERAASLGCVPCGKGSEEPHEPHWLCLAEVPFVDPPVGSLAGSRPMRSRSWFGLPSISWTITLSLRQLPSGQPKGVLSLYLRSLRETRGLGRADGCGSNP